MPFEKYNAVITKLNAIRDGINNANSQIKAINDEREGDIPQRIKNIEDQLEKIDEYLLKVRAFQDLAKRNITSLNVQTIYAPPDYRVSLKRLRDWSLMITPNSNDDPYAQRVYVVAKCDEFFLEKKKKEFTQKLEQLKNDREIGATEAIKALEAEIEGYEAQLDTLADSVEVAELATVVVSQNMRLWLEEVPVEYPNRFSAVSSAPGAYALPLPFGERQKEKLKTLMGKFYDEVNGRVLIPVEFEPQKEFILTINCASARSRQLDRGLQNFILSQINNSEAGLRKVYVLDGMRYNSASIGSLKQLEGTFALEQIPRNPEQMTATLEKIVAGLSDMDDALEMCDSVAEYNSQTTAGKRLPHSTMILYGWPNSFSGRDKELLSRIMTNYERYGFSFVTVTYSGGEKLKEDKSYMPEYALGNAIRIMMGRKETKIAFSEENEYRFTWYTMGDALPVTYAESLKANKITKDTIGNEYPKRYPYSGIGDYTRQYKKIELPAGIDGKDNAHFLSFENENFAAYLMGASRSGKSTLIHTLIAGIIKNYHPDNVELWLADFKQLEFKRYIRHLPPHIKYVLLDESPELVYDLIDKLTNEMLERQKIFAVKGVQRIDQIDPTTLSKPMPVIFVILDEFSIMSQAIAESSVYKLRLQNILAKGAALGIRFLFASQTFTTGVSGLTSTARAQIQQRIAMKASKEEISETLELSSSLKTEQVRNWIDALPPHYALIKHRTEGADPHLEVKRLYAMYYPDYEVRDAMIDDINKSMHKVENYNPMDITSYVDKKPVLVDGNTFEAFDEKAFMDEVANYKQNHASDLVGDEMFMAFGTPRRMVSMKLSALSQETRENILLLGRQAEQQTSAAVLLSAMRSYKLQGGIVQIWAYSKNRMFRAFKKTFQHFGFEIIEDIDAVCDEIRDLKAKMEKRETDNRLIVMIGIDRIAMDFDFVDGGAKADVEEQMAEIKKITENEAALVTTDAQEREHEYTMAWGKLKRELKKKLKAEGVSEADMDAVFKEERAKLKKEMGLDTLAPAAQHKQSEAPKHEEKKPEKVGGAYNAADDLTYILKQGSRLGYHFMMHLNSIEDIKTTGLKIDYFRYRLAFAMSADDSRSVFGSKIASLIPERICQYDDKMDSYSFRPYLNGDTAWDGWYVDENGKAVSPFEA